MTDTLYVYDSFQVGISADLYAVLIGCLILLGLIAAAKVIEAVKGG